MVGIFLMMLGTQWLADGTLPAAAGLWWLLLPMALLAAWLFRHSAHIFHDMVEHQREELSARFDLSADRLIELRKSRVSERVILAMIGVLGYAGIRIATHADDPAMVDQLGRRPFATVIADRIRDVWAASPAGEEARRSIAFDLYALRLRVVDPGLAAGRQTGMTAERCRGVQRSPPRLRAAQRVVWLVASDEPAQRRRRHRRG
mgnify:CR=1 FL=1